MRLRNVISCPTAPVARCLALLMPSLAAGRAWPQPAPDSRSAFPASGDPSAWYDVGGVVLLLGLGLVVVTMLRYRGALRRARIAGEARYRSLVEAAPSGVVVHRDGRVLYINGGARRILGLTDGRSVAGVSLAELAPAADEGRADHPFSSHSADARESSDTVQLRRADGSVAEVRLAGIASSFDGDPARLTFFRDVTAELAAQRELESSREHLEKRGRLAATFLATRGDGLRSALGTLLQEILESPTACVGVFDLGGRMRLACTGPATSAGTAHHSILDPLDIPAALQEVIASDGPLILDRTGAGDPQAPLLGVSILGGDRILGLVSVSGRTRAYHEEDARMLADVAADLAPLIQAHLETDAKDAQLLHAHKMEALGSLAGGIAHDFNNILQAIMGFTALARQDAGDAASLDADLDRVERSAERGRDLVQRILRFSRPEALESAPLDPLPLLQEMVRHLQGTLPGQIVVESRLATDCGLVRAEPRQLLDTLLNLTENARQAMETGGGRLSLILRRLPVNPGDHRFPVEWSSRDVVEIAVADTGPGIPEGDRRRLFDPFFTTREVGQGAGLGLSVVQALVRALGGCVGIECPAAGGTVISIYLPHCDAAAGPSSP